MSNSVTVLAYHRIAHPSQDDALAPSLIDAYPEAFEAQMRHIASAYEVVSSWELVEALRGGGKLPRKALIITFDDGYRCFTDTAMPILRKLDLPVTLCVPTEYPGRPERLFWWDELHRALALTARPPSDAPGFVQNAREEPSDRNYVFARLVERMERMSEAEAADLLARIVEWSGAAPNTTSYMLSWDEIRALEKEGVSVAPHTRSHIILSQGGQERVWDEVSGSWADLQREVANPLPIFCYPNGKPHALSSTAVSAVKRAGLVGAYTMVGGLNVVGRTDPYYMYRIGAVAGESLARFRFKIGWAGRVYRGLKR